MFSGSHLLYHFSMGLIERSIVLIHTVISLAIPTTLLQNVHWQPLPIWSSPMGPLGQTQAFIFFVGHAFFGLYNYLVLNQGFSHTTAAFLFAFGGMATGLVTMILVAILMSGKVKED